ncbi:hypothetical protein EP331_10650 [bacterium]|nr:MAG: hypothetical protein EP331_10650 [bacterium]
MYHILNGDSLLQQLPETIAGEKIVFREALIDGDVSGTTSEAFFQNRAVQFAHFFDEVTIDGYMRKSKDEIERINHIPIGETVYLWFEEDAFCQINFWYAIHRLIENGHTKLFLVRPEYHTRYAFSGHQPEELTGLLQGSSLLTQLSVLTKLWPAYQEDSVEQLRALGEQLAGNYPFIKEAITNLIGNSSTSRIESKVETLITEIVQITKSNEFKDVFRFFAMNYPQFGLGDLQVERIFKKLSS